MSETKISLRPNGPLRVEGAVKLVDSEGGEWNVADKPGISLCRCGHSANKPFCDGSHAKAGFQDDTKAPK